MMIEELAFVTLQGSTVPCSHAVLVKTWSGWHLELEDVPGDCRRFLEGECDITFDTWDGHHYQGTVRATCRRTEPTCLMLAGQGLLSQETLMVPESEDADGVKQS